MHDGDDDTDETATGAFRHGQRRSGRLAVSATGIVDTSRSGFRIAVGSFFDRQAARISRLELGIPLRLAVVGGLVAAALANMPWRAADGVAEEGVEAAMRQVVPLPALLEQDPVDAGLPVAGSGPSVAVATRPRLSRARPDPQSLCDVMAGGPGIASWDESEVIPGQWECVMDFSESEDTGKAGPIFSIIRGRDADTVDIIRLKLSIAEGDAEPRWHRLMTDMAASLASAAGGTLPAPIRTSLETLKPARAVENGLEIEFAPERMFPGRYNLIIKLRSS